MFFELGPEILQFCSRVFIFTPQQSISVNMTIKPAAQGFAVDFRMPRGMGSPSNFKSGFEYLLLSEAAP